MGKGKKRREEEGEKREMRGKGRKKREERGRKMGGG